MDKIDKIGDSVLLYHGDCLEEMNKIPDGSVDLVLTDPPYGTTACKWDSVIPFEPMWAQLKRVAKKNAAIVLFGSEPFSSALRMSNIKRYKYDWVWDKVNAGNFLVAKYAPLKTTENITVFCLGGSSNYYPIMTDGEKDRSSDNPTEKRTDLFSRIKSGQFKPGNNKAGTQRYPKHLIRVSNASRTEHYHPTQKPVALLEYLIRTYTNEGETVLDFTMGSGSTGVACMNTSRKFIGIELDEKYYHISKKRIEEAVRFQQTSMVV